MGLHKGAKLTDAPKDTMLRVRLDAETLAQLEYVADQQQLTKSDVVRKGIKAQYDALNK